MENRKRRNDLIITLVFVILLTLNVILGFLGVVNYPTPYEYLTSSIIIVLGYITIMFLRIGL